MKEIISLSKKVGSTRTNSIIYPYHMVMCGCMILLSVLISLTVSAIEINNGKITSSGGKVIFITESALMSSVNTSVSGECGATMAPLTGTSCSATSETVKYGFKLKNTGSKAGIFLLTSTNEKSSLLNNPDKSSTKSNVGLISECRDVNNNPITKIEIQSNQEIVFYLLVFVPKDSPKGLWNSILVKVNPVLCPATEITIPVFTYIPDAEKDVLGFIDTGCFIGKSLENDPEMALIIDGLI
jgi:hypothetical protein